MRTDPEYTISAAAIRLYNLGVDVFSTNQLERELWHAMCPFVSVRRSVFRRAAKDVLSRAPLAMNNDMLERAPVIADDANPGIRKTVLSFAMDLLEKIFTRPFLEPDLEPVYVRLHLTLGNLARELGLPGKALLAYQEALDRAEEVSHDHPCNGSLQLLRSTAYTGLALAYQDVKCFALAESTFQRALDSAQQLAGRHPNDATYHVAVAEILIKLAVMYEATGRLAQAHPILDQARERLDQSRLLQPPLDSLQGGRLVYRCDIDQMEPPWKWAHMVLHAFCDASQAWRGLALRPGQSHQNRQLAGKCLTTSLHGCHHASVFVYFSRGGSSWRYGSFARW